VNQINRDDDSDKTRISVNLLHMPGSHPAITNRKVEDA
jgi:hypothetical protein